MKTNLTEYKKLLKGIDGVREKELKIIEDKSSYNHNFYYFVKDFVHYIVLGESNDDDETKWWWCDGDAKLFIGRSWITGETIHAEEKETF